MVKQTKGSGRRMSTQVSTQRRLLVNQTMKALKLFFTEEQYSAFFVQVRDQLQRATTLQDYVDGNLPDVLASIKTYAKDSMTPEAYKMMLAFLGHQEQEERPRKKKEAPPISSEQQEVLTDLATRLTPQRVHHSRVKFTLGAEISKTLDSLEKTPQKPQRKQKVGTNKISLPKQVGRALKLSMDNEENPLSHVDLDLEIRKNIFRTFPVSLCSRKHKGKCNELGISVHISNTMAQKLKVGQYTDLSTGTWLNPCLSPRKAPTTQGTTPIAHDTPMEGPQNEPTKSAVPPPGSYGHPDSKDAQFHFLAKDLILGTAQCTKFESLCRKWKGPFPKISNPSPDAIFVMTTSRPPTLAQNLGDLLRRAMTSRKRPSTSRRDNNPRGKHARR